jgi:bifunctional non-homologous end joining protein LigD
LDPLVAYVLARFPPARSRSKPPGFILPCQPALAERPPAGPGWLHEIKFDGYGVIARKDGERVRLWASEPAAMRIAGMRSR